MTKMTYADAVKRVEIWRLDEMGGKLLSDADHEALSVLRRAGKVMGEIEKANVSHYRDVVVGSTVRVPYFADGDDDILRESLAYKEQPK